jgi:hypothetical protein
MDMIDLLPPGLYEAVITEVDEGTANPDLIHGKYLFRLEARTLEDIRRLGANSEEDNQRFATAARVSEINLGLYHTLARPAVQAMASSQSADLMQQRHPSRRRFAAFSDSNPAMAPVKTAMPTRFGPTASRWRPTIRCSRWSRSRRHGSPPAGKPTGWRAMP